MLYNILFLFDHYRKLEAEVIRIGEQLDHSKIYVEAITKVSKDKKHCKLETEVIRMGEQLDHSKIYVEAITEVNKDKKNPRFLGIMV